LRKPILIAIPVLLALAAWVLYGPLPEGLLDPGRFASLTITDRNGVVLFEGLAADGTRSWRSEDAVPERVIDAIVAAEDRRFFLHPGIDPLAIARAAAANLRAGAIEQGGSTITQQTAKLLLADHPAHRGGRVARKAREALVALRLERKLSKRQIAALYLELAPFGNQYRGLERASRGYFGVPAERLTIAQAALLAALPQRPSALDPRRHLDRARVRQRLVLDRMLDAESITIEERRVAGGEGLRILPGGNELLAPHLVARLQRELRASKRTSLATTIDAGFQRVVRGILDAHRPRLARHDAHNVAVVVLHVPTGEWLAWEGSGDYFDDQNGGAIDGALVPRQPGSALKPFAYAAAFDAGFGAESVLPDVESSFPTAEEGIVYVPRNYDGVFRGPVRAREALAGSLNVPAVWLASRIGVPAFLGALRGAGLTGSARCSAAAKSRWRSWSLPTARSRGAGSGRSRASSSKKGSPGSVGCSPPRRRIWSPTSSTTTTRAAWRSGGAEASSSRFPRRRRRAPRRRTATTGRSASPARSRWASGSATSTGASCATRAG
jgi:penicillin-binding protein 1C